MHIKLQINRSAQCWMNPLSFKLVVSPSLVSKLGMIKATHKRFWKSRAKKVSVCLQDQQDNKLVASIAVL